MTKLRCTTVLAVALILGGCAPIAGPSGGPGGPTFEGPWATELREAYDRATAEIQRDVLADGTITDAEYAELIRAFETCVSGAGLRLSWVGTKGGFAIDGGDHAAQEPILRRCNDETDGAVTMLYHAQHRNPDNLDERAIMASCLVRMGVVDKSYGAKEYELDFLSEASTTWSNSEPFYKCNEDPVGAQP